MERRTWDTPVREHWNPVIHQMLRAIDRHNACYFTTRDEWHITKAAELRRYVVELKDWIKSQENADHP